MKKKVIMALILVMALILMPVAAFASETEKGIPVELTVIPDQINLGESIIVNATVEKHGSLFRDNWTNAQKVITEYDGITGQYLSTAEFKPTCAGTYEITYQIVMESGSSGVVFKGAVSKTVIVADTKTVVGAAIKNVTQSPVMNGDQIIMYMVTGQAYAIWSDGTQTDLNQSIFVFFSPYENQKEVMVSFNLEGKDYLFKTCVSR